MFIVEKIMDVFWNVFEFAGSAISLVLTGIIIFYILKVAFFPKPKR